MPPSTWPPSPTVTCSTRTSPFTVPSIWISPPPEILPSSTMSAAIREVTLGPRAGAGRAEVSSVGAGAGAAAAGCGAAGVAAGWPPVGVLVGLLNIIAGLYETEGVLGAAVDPHFIVQVRAGGTSGGAHGADLLTEHHMLADLDGDGREVGIAGLEPMAMVDLDRIAVARAHAGEGDDAGRRHMDRRAVRTGPVLAGMEGGTAGEGIGPLAETAG